MRKPGMLVTRGLRGRLTCFAALAIALFGFLDFPGTAYAETGDTQISIHYRTKSVRVRPTARVGGANVDFMIVLRADGKVQDGWSVRGGKSGSTKGKIGPKASGAVYRVLDAGTITRTADTGSHLHKITVRTSGKNCKATVEFTLKPGQKEYRDYSIELGTMAYFSSLSAEYVTCV